jgi:hypothetical protein
MARTYVCVLSRLGRTLPVLAVIAAAGLAAAACGSSDMSNASSSSAVLASAPATSAAHPAGGSGSSSSATASSPSNPVIYPTVPADSTCGDFSPQDESTMLGQPVQGYEPEPSRSCMFVAGPKGSLTKFVMGTVEYVCGSYAADQWGVYDSATTSVAIKGGKYGVRAMWAAGDPDVGYNDAVKLPNGCVLSGTAGISLGGKPVGAAKANLLQAIYDAYQKLAA